MGWNCNNMEKLSSVIILNNLTQKYRGTQLRIQDFFTGETTWPAHKTLRKVKKFTIAKKLLVSFDLHDKLEFFDRNRHCFLQKWTTFKRKQARGHIFQNFLLFFLFLRFVGNLCLCIYIFPISPGRGNLPKVPWLR